MVTALYYRRLLSLHAQLSIYVAYPAVHTENRAAKASTWLKKKSCRLSHRGESVRSYGCVYNTNL